MKILVLNAGSSSHKSCLFDLSSQDADHAPRPLWRAALDWTHQEGSVELSASGAGESIQQVLSITDKAEGITAMVKTLVEGPTQVLGELAEIAAVGHRVVHGGRHYQQPVVVDDEVKATIQSLVPLAPAHNPANLQGIEAIAQSLGTIPQVAVFDTAFHSHMPEAAATYPGPYAWVEQDIRRYGFHGISHQYVAQRAADLMGQDIANLRLLTCHLGNGCSLAAVKNGVCVDTTMGFTPLDGLMMGSRSGSVDPGILIYLMRQEGYTADQLDRLLNKESGLKGLSGRSNDMRAVVEAMEQGDAQAKLAIEVFIHRLRREMGAMIASLGGLDGVVFTAGVGENSPLVWQQACAPFEFLGLRLKDELGRDEADQDIAAADSAVRVLVVHTQEEWAIAQACVSLLQPNHA
ncbi:MAG: acetate kinase [Nodosilinea sp. WJT8-NPBG4]|jgi:acetate kinase|nr:acetate kinase [Nodosilinea sp. WJT8-NPBG4]